MIESSWKICYNTNPFGEFSGSPLSSEWKNEWRNYMNTTESTTCNICKENLPNYKFTKHNKNDCYVCRTREYALQRKKDNFANSIYVVQIYSSKKRGHTPPEYTLQELEEWLYGQDLFKKLYIEWEESGHNTLLLPSVDRLDDDIGYSFENIRLTTWEENRYKGWQTNAKRQWSV